MAASNADCSRRQVVPDQSCWSAICCCRPCTCAIVVMVLLYLLAGVYFFFIPIVFRCSFALRREVLFCNHYNTEVDGYERSGFPRMRRQTVQTKDDISLGVWYIPPSTNESHPESQPPTANMTVLYAHGTSGSRSVHNRLVTYHLMTERLQTSVVAFDYRGFADSVGGQPTADGIINDTLALYEWILSEHLSTPKEILFWGQSLGTAVVVGALSQLSEEMTPLSAVLEAPFTNMREEIWAFPLSRFFNFLPYFEYAFVDPIVNDEKLNFDSVALLPKVKAPLLVLHSEDDPIIPYHIGKRLYESAKQLQPAKVANKTTFHGFPPGKEYNHDWICQAPDLPHVVAQFITSVLN